MAVAKVIAISAASPDSFEKAIESGISKASESLQGVRSAWIKEQKVMVENGKVTEYRVDMKVTFVLQDQPAA